MTVGRRYAAGLAAAAGVAILVVAFVPAGIREVVALAVILGFVVQAPLGWFLVRAFGKEQFLPVWGLGIGTRFVAVLLLAVLGSRISFPALETLLVGLVATLFCLLLVEAGALLKGEAE